MVFQQGKLLNYYSRKLTPIETNYTIGNKKMLTVIIALKYWRHFTQGTKYKILVHIDHKGLMFFLETKQLSPKQVWWLKEFAYYDFAIKHIKSENNIGTDALSRKPDYKKFDELIKPMLVKNGKYMQVTETT